MRSKLKPLVFLTLLFTVAFTSIAFTVYGAFTRQLEPSANNIGITISTTDYLLLSTDGTPSSYVTQVNFPESIYEDSIIPAYGVVRNYDESTNKYLSIVKIKSTDTVEENGTIEFDLYFLANSDQTIYLDASNNNIALEAYAPSDPSIGAAERDALASAVRIGFQVYETSVDGQYFTSPSLSAIFTNGDLGENDYDEYVFNNTNWSTKPIASIKALVPLKMHFVIWVEKDSLSDELIAMGNILINLKFKSAPVTTSASE